MLLLSKPQKFVLQQYGITYAPASHASCEAALRTLLRHTEALAEQSSPPSLQASLQIRLGLNIERRENEKGI